MEIKVTAFGIAKDILNGKTTVLKLNEGQTIADVRQALISNYPDFKKLTSLQFAVNADYVTEAHVVQPNDEVVLIPPVSGG